MGADPRPEQVYDLLKALGLLGAPRDVQQEAIDAWLARHEPTPPMRASLVRGEWVVLEDLPPPTEPPRDRRWLLWVAAVVIAVVCLLGVYAIYRGETGGGCGVRAGQPNYPCPPITEPYP